jgi:hypothetical protein
MGASPDALLLLFTVAPGGGQPRLNFVRIINIMEKHIIFASRVSQFKRQAASHVPGSHVPAMKRIEAHPSTTADAPSAGRAWPWRVTGLRP